MKTKFLFLFTDLTTYSVAQQQVKGNSNLQLILKVNNITSETYSSGVLNQFRLTPGAPRNVLLTATYKF